MESKLIFDPVHRTLLDKQGRIVKRLHCPKLQSWHLLAVAADNQVAQRHCDSCDKAVLDTAQMTAKEIVRAVRTDPDVCFRICLEQANIEIKVGND